MNRLDDGVRPPTAAEKLIFRWDSSSSSGFDDSCFRMLFDGDNRAEAQRYLRAVDEVRRTSMRRRDSFGSRTADSGSGGGGTTGGTGSMARSASVALKAAMARLEEEVRHIIFTRSIPIEMDSVFESFASMSINSTAGSDFGGSSRCPRPRRGAAPVEDDADEDAYDEQRHNHGEDEEEEEDDVGDGDDDGGDQQTSLGSGTIRRCSMSAIAEFDLLPPDAIADLRSIAEQMVAAGYARECFQAYTSARRAALESALQQVGTDRFAPGDVHRLSWDAVEAKIRRWGPAARVCVRAVFASERRLCDVVFEGLGLDAGADEAAIQQQQQMLHHNRRRSGSRSGSSSWAPEMPFLDMVKGPVKDLFGFVDAISNGPRSPEKLFKILDLHDTIKDLIPDIRFVFRGSSSTAEGLDTSSPSLSSPDSITTMATGILSRLADAIRGIVTEFESAIHHEASARTVPGGTLHPLTRYVMNYLSLITEYKQSLHEVLVTPPSASDLLHPPADNPNAQSPPPPDVDFRTLENTSPFSAHLVWIIAILDSNLEAKSRMYKDHALTSIFVMNNAHYIVNKVKASDELREIIGDDFLRRIKGKYQQAATAYQRAAWVKVLHCLREEGLHPTGTFSSGISRNTLRERFRAFNTAFEEAHRTQSTWSVPDEQLRQELRISISARLLPAYRAFLGRYGPVVEGGRHPELYIKYTVDQLEIALDDFFEGTALSSRRGH